MKKLIKYVLLITVLLLVMQSIAYANTVSTTTTSSTGDSYTQIKTKIVPIIQALSWFGYAIALGMFMYVGIKYMLSTADDRARVKQGLINFLIGAVIIAGASTLANIVSVVAMGGTAQTTEGLANKIIEAGKVEDGRT